jgi:hypothetical protein
VKFITECTRSLKTGGSSVSILADRGIQREEKNKDDGREDKRQLGGHRNR